jgi:hypothetical protein
MPRPRLHAGEIGTIRMVELTHGGFQANARMRDESGQLRRLKVVGGTTATKPWVARRAPAVASWPASRSRSPSGRIDGSSL